MIDIASVIRPSSVIASASSNGSPAGLELLGRLRVGRAVRHDRREVEDRHFVADGVREVAPGQLDPFRGLDTGLLSQLPADTVERRLRGRHAALRDLPRPGVERVAVLADQQDAIVLVEDHDPAARFAKWITP